MLKIVLVTDDGKELPMDFAKAVEYAKSNKTPWQFVQDYYGDIGITELRFKFEKPIRSDADLYQIGAEIDKTLGE